MTFKPSKEQQETKNIEYNFSELGIEEYDILWKEYLQQMKQLEKICLEIELLVVNIQLLCNSYLLSKPQYWMNNWSMMRGN